MGDVGQEANALGNVLGLMFQWKLGPDSLFRVVVDQAALCTVVGSIAVLHAFVGRCEGIVVVFLRGLTSVDLDSTEVPVLLGIRLQKIEESLEQFPSRGRVKLLGVEYLERPADHQMEITLLAIFQGYLR